jgi:GNAT superfamily N-acetyltransferase
VIRRRQAEDFEPCVQVLREVYLTDRYPFIWPADPGGWLAGRDGLAAWVAEEGDQLVGHLSLHATDASRARPQWREASSVPIERLAVVSRFFVSPAARGHGIGGALMSRAEEHAAANGLHLVLDVAEHNRDAIGFYARRGWRRVGNAELALSAEPWTLHLVVFVRE